MKMQNTNNSPFPLMISVVVLDAAQLTSVYALLGGVLNLNAAVNVPGKYQPNQGDRPETVSAPRDTAKSSGTDETLAQDAQGLAGTGETATTGVSPSDDGGEIDAHGHPWSADLHASTKGKTKDGLWRMKVGVTRPDPKPGFPVDAPAAGTGTSSETEAPSATSQTATAAASGQPATSGEDDDEFAAFRAAAAASDAVDQTAAANVPARTYTDADLGALCNQAAVKLGDPSPIKEIIARYTPEGQVAHSRNIPEDKRADFVKEVEDKAGIQFAG
jgi:hypothetical protein